MLFPITFNNSSMLFLRNCLRCCFFILLGSTNASAYTVNLDNSHFFVSDCGQSTTEGELMEWLASVIPAEASTVVFGINAQKSSFRSSVFENVVDSAVHPDMYKKVQCWKKSLKTLEDHGIEPYSAWIKMTRKMGKEAWISVRVNDVHFANDLNYPLHSEFWLTNPQLRITDSAMVEGWFAESLDYSKPQVAERFLKYVWEAVERYQPDGVEIDWMRFGIHISPERVSKGENLDYVFNGLCNIKDKWIDIKHSHRVPFSPAAAIFTGFNLESPHLTCVDRFVVSPFWTTNSMDLPIRAWRKELEESKSSMHIKLHAGMDVNWRSYPLGETVNNSAALINSFRAAMSLRERVEIYFFNFLEYQDAVKQTMTDSRRDIPLTYFDFPISDFQNAKLPLWVFRSKALPSPNLEQLLDDGDGFVRLTLSSRLGMKGLSMTSAGGECEIMGTSLDEVEFKCPEVSKGPVTLFLSVPTSVNAIVYSSYSKYIR